MKQVQQPYKSSKAIYNTFVTWKPDESKPERTCMETLTIGQLAKRAGLRPSALRYYEEEGLLKPVSRTASGYRLYDPEAEQTLQFIQRARRLGLALADIRVLLEGIAGRSLTSAAILQTVEERYIALERQVTEGLVLRHEMGQFLQELYQKTARNENISADAIFERLLKQVCAAPLGENTASMLDWLIEHTHCQLTSTEGLELIEQLRGQHVHIWLEEGAYHILTVSSDPKIGAAIQALANLENSCQTHAHTTESPSLEQTEEGYLLTTRGDNAFIFARLFLNLSENFSEA